MYASDWIFGLFASVIPLENMHAFLTRFFQDKWIFFYQLILTILKFLEKELLQEDELWSILNQIKSQTHTNTAIASSQSSANKSSKRKKRIESGISSVTYGGANAYDESANNDSFEDTGTGIVNEGDEEH